MLCPTEDLGTSAADRLSAFKPLSGRFDDVGVVRLTVGMSVTLSTFSGWAAFLSFGYRHQTVYTVRWGVGWVISTLVKIAFGPLLRRTS
jgi:hypothetical protein